MALTQLRTIAARRTSAGRVKPLTLVERRIVHVVAALGGSAKHMTVVAAQPITSEQGVEVFGKGPADGVM